MSFSKSFFWITASGLILFFGLMIIYQLLPPESILVFGTISLSLKGVFAAVFVFFSVWLVMYRLLISLNISQLILLVLKGVLAITIGELLYQTWQQFHTSNVLLSEGFIVIVKHSYITVIIGLLFAISIAIYYRTKSLKRTIITGLLLWLALGIIIKYLVYDN